MYHNPFKLILIAGPTAVGKTELSVRIAKELECEIISADSRQVYKELNIGTAKPSVEERQEVRHYFIGNKNIHDYYSAGKFESEVIALIGELSLTTDKAIMTGGSGLYIQAVCEGIDVLPGPNETIRHNLENTFRHRGLEPLQTELKEKDPDTWQVIDLNNPKRVIRALEIIRQTGKTISSMRKGRKDPRDFEIIKIGLELDRDELYRRINKRADKMLEEGLLDEVRSLLPFKHLAALQTVGYQEFFGYFEKEYDLQEAIRLFKRNSRRYAKRQMSWFKRDKNIQWFHPADFKSIMKAVYEFIH